MDDLKRIKKYVEIRTRINDIGVKKRPRDHADARFLYFKIAKKATIKSFREIGEVVNRDHSSVIHGIVMFDNLLVKKPFYNQILVDYLLPDDVDKVVEAKNIIRLTDSNLLLRNKNHELKTELRRLNYKLSKYKKSDLLFDHETRFRDLSEEQQHLLSIRFKAILDMNHATTARNVYEYPMA